jgi:rod shape-determining protein MreC
MPEELGFGPRLVLRVTLPLQRMVTLPIGLARTLWSDYVALVGLRRDNLRLSEELAHLSEENLQYREALVASDRFKRLSGFGEQHDVPMVPANVVAEDLSPWFRSIILDQGAAAGILPGMPVITDTGLVGVVSGTTPRASKVLLVTDPQSRIDAYVQRTRARGTVHGRARPSCDFEYLLRDEDVRGGDRLLTSGRGALYPKGLLIGRIADVDRKPYGLFQAASVKLEVDFEKLEEVFVILERRDVPEAEDFDGAALWAEGAPE